MKYTSQKAIIEALRAGAYLSEEYNLIAGRSTWTIHPQAEVARRASMAACDALEMKQLIKKRADGPFYREWVLA